MDDEAVFIEVRLRNGKVMRAENDHAKEVWNWICSVESFYMQRFGMRTCNAQPMIEIEPARKEMV